MKQSGLFRGFTLLLVFLPFLSFAQTFHGHQADSIIQNADEVYLWPYSKYPRYIHFKQPKPLVSEAEAYLKKLFQLDERFRLNLLLQETDKEGFTHRKYQVLFQGIKVDGSIIRLHLQNNKLISIDAALFALPSSSSHALDGDEALQIALNKHPESEWIWMDEKEEQLLKDLKNNPSVTFRPLPEKIWFPKDPAHPEKEWRAAWTFKIYSLNPLFHHQVYVDAENGDILFEENLIHDINTFGTAQTKYSGTRTIRVDSMNNGLYRLRDSSLLAQIQTLDLNNTKSYANGVDFIDSNNVWNTVNTQQDEIATDAHWGAEMTYTYFYQNFNRISFDNQAATIRSYVHYGTKYNNAFWNGYFMTYGDGNGTTFTPLTCIDVCGHEIAHAVTTHTANLIYQNESGALNESFSDIFGNSIEFETKSSASWKIGEEITPNGSGIRNMQKPKVKGDPDTYLGQYWYGGTGDNGGVHTNSGVQNFWYYLLCEGDTGTNDNNDFFEVDSLGQAVAQQIAYRSLSTYLSRYSPYSDARYFSILSAKDLYGACSKEVIATTNAWHACGVGDVFDSSSVKANFSSDDFSCFTPASFAFLNYSENATSYHWDFGDGTTDTSEHPTHNFTSYGFYDIKLVAFNCFGNGSDTLTKTQYILIDSTPDICHALTMPFNAVQKTEYCQGYIYDDGGEGAYSDMHESYLSIKTPGADSIGVVFLEFSYEKNYDYLFLFEGYDSSGTQLGKYTGTNLPNSGDTLYIQGDAITLRHSSDPAVVGAGFKLFYQAFRPGVRAIAPVTQEVCIGDSIQLHADWVAPDSSVLAFYWIDSLSRQILAEGNDVWFKPDSNTTLGLVLLDACMLIRDTAYFNINMRDPLLVSSWGDTVLCHLQNGQFIASASGGDNNAYQFYWPELGISGDTVQASFAHDTMLHTIVTDGCTELPDTSTWQVQVRAPLQVELLGDSLLCTGNSATFEANSSGGDSTNYTWYFEHGGANFGNILIVAYGANRWIPVRLEDNCSLLPAEDSIYLHSIPGISYALSNDSLLCDGQSMTVELSVLNGDFNSMQISWTGDYIGADSNFSSSTTTDETYFLELNDQCTLIQDTVRALHRAPLQLLPELDTLICSGEALYKNLEATGGTGTYQFVWSDAYSGEFRNWVPSFTTTYQVIGSDGCSLEDTTTFTVQLRQPLSVYAGAALTACEDQLFTLQASAQGGDSTQYAFYWNGFLRNDTASFSAKTDRYFTVKVSDNCSADAIDSVLVSIRIPQIPEIIFEDQLICTNQEIEVSLDFQVQSQSWRISDGQIFSTPDWTSSWDKPNKLSVSLSIVDFNGCEADTLYPDAIEVVPAAVATLNLNEDAFLLGQDPLIAEATNQHATLWQWTLSDGASYSTRAIQHAFADTGFIYLSLYVEDKAGCSDFTEDTLRVFDQAKIWIPNSFTPNKDGVNDVLVLSALNIERGSYQIFDRWGSLVYSCDDLHQCAWNGETLNGGNAPTGVYMLVFKGYSHQNERVTEKTTLLLIR